MSNLESNRVRFGDGKHGKIPPQGADIICQRYQKILGFEARVLAGEISELRSEIPGIPRSEVLVFNKTDAVGGTGVFAISEGLSKGLELYKETFRGGAEERGSGRVWSLLMAQVLCCG